MNPKILIAGIAVAAMTGVAAQAAGAHGGGAYAEPSQPIAYSSLNAYMKASPKAKRTRDWSGGSAASATSAGANASATEPAATPAPMATPDATATPDTTTSAQPMQQPAAPMAAPAAPTTDTTTSAQ